MSVKDELPGGAAPSTLAQLLAAASPGAQEIWHPQEQQKHLTLLEQHQQRQPLAFPKVTAKSQANLSPSAVPSPASRSEELRPLLLLQ
jgi:hypothetical protein